MSFTGTTSLGFDMYCRRFLVSGISFVVTTLESSVVRGSVEGSSKGFEASFCRTCAPKGGRQAVAMT